MAKSTAVEFVMGKIREARENGPKKSWFSRLPAESQSRLNEIKEAFLAGKFAGASLATIHAAIVSLCREHKWQEPKSVGTIKAWLHSSDISM